MLLGLAPAGKELHRPASSPTITAIGADDLKLYSPQADIDHSTGISI
jgi:hypothetical protein